jgi:Arc/MetJ-type ribon-helix-helix transcriptional regulator
MPYPFPADVSDLLQMQMALGGYSSEDDVLRDALRALERQEVLSDIRAGLAELEVGRGHALHEVGADLRQRYGIARQP